MQIKELFHMKLHLMSFVHSVCLLLFQFKTSRKPWIGANKITQLITKMNKRFIQPIGVM